MTMSNKSVIDPELKVRPRCPAHRYRRAAPASTLQRLQNQVDAIDVKMAGKLYADSSFGTGSTLLKTIQENESIHRILKDKRGTAVLHLKGSEVAELMDRKSIISGIATGSAGTDTLNPVGASTSGVSAD